MSYTNATFYIDIENGSDTARSTLAGVVFSNPSGTIVRGTKVAHGLVTGAVVDVSATTNGNGAYKITRIDADTFDLDATLWAVFTGADVTGDVVPRGGASWTDAWKTPLAGATDARTQSGDVGRLAKSPAPYSVGNAAWTNQSRTVTLATALTLLIDDCESGWTAANGATVTHTGTSKKSGSSDVRITKASYATGTKYAYKTLSGTLDFSSFEAICGWLKTSSAIADAARWVICLCSDTTGDAIVDSFAVTALAISSRYTAFRHTRSGGTFLGSAIQSIAVYSGASAPPNNQVLQLDNLNACSATGFSILSLISKTSSEVSTAEGWRVLQSINGVTLELDNSTDTLAYLGQGYYGDTETVESFGRETIKLASSVSGNPSDCSVQRNGFELSGGWNPLSGSQDGETFIDGLCGSGVGLHVTSSDVTCSRISAVRFAYGVYVTNVRSDCSVGTVGGCSIGVQFNSGSSDVTDCVRNNVDAVVLVANERPWAMNVCRDNVLRATVVTCNLLAGRFWGSGLPCLANQVEQIETYRCPSVVGFDSSWAIGNTFIGGVTDDVDVVANFSDGARANTVKNVVVTDPVVTAAVISGYWPMGDNVFVDCSLAARDVVDTDSSRPGTNGRIVFQNYDLSGYDEVSVDGGMLGSEATTRPSTTGKQWYLTPQATRTIDYPLDLEIVEFACDANKEVTVTLGVSKAHASNVNAKLMCRGGQISGVDADVVAVKPNTTAWDDIEISFTPTQKGTVKIEVLAEYVSGSAKVAVKGLTIVQAA